MKVIQETELKDFEAWSGGARVLDELAGNALDYASSFLDELAEGAKGLSETEINDWLWFECEEYLREVHELNIDGTDWNGEE